jgi:hypothetical protein
MVTRTCLGGARGRAIAAIVGAGAAALMVVVTIATDGPAGAGAANAQPTSQMGSTVTWEPPTTTTPPAVPATEKAVPTVKAPHR